MRESSENNCFFDATFFLEGRELFFDKFPKSARFCFCFATSIGVSSNGIQNTRDYVGKYFVDKNFGNSCCCCRSYFERYTHENIISFSRNGPDEPSTPETANLFDSKQHLQHPVYMCVHIYYHLFRIQRIQEERDFKWGLKNRFKSKMKI